MDDSTSDCQLNQGEVDYEFESNEVPEPLSLVDEQFVPKVGMTFTTLEDTENFYRNYAKAAGFFTRVRSTNRKGNKIKNQLITCSKEEKWKSKISPTEKTNPTTSLNCPARIYIHTIICCAGCCWIIRRTIENNEEASIRPSKTYQSFVAAAGGHRELNFIEKDVRNYITREVRNISEQEDAKEFRKYLLIMKEKNQNFFFELELEEDQSIKLAFWADARSRAVFEYFRNVISFDATHNTNSSFVGVNHHGYSVYEVGEQVSSSIFNKFVVTYDSVAVEVNRRHTHIKSNHDEPLLEPRSERFDQLVFCSQNICEFTSKSEELTVILHRAYDNVMVEMESLKAKRKGTSSLSHEDANLESVNELQSPPRIRTRGRSKNRLGLKLDKQIANATKKKKTKGLNEIKLNLFDTASVVHSNSSQYQGRVMNYQFRALVAADNSLGV
ncbi:hypothetical protein Ahy_A07g033050 [Arachis hypogaea]|uniref:Uncharacterized protein n=1 Tax=Arachis hypogaea TaxID=3818 RepID=A0A445C8D9_ARAHY|nr:hypothetical protein Ahy_A07g033050 [Arachis hypogaea]